MYRRTSNMVGLSYPPAVIEALKVIPIKSSYNVYAALQKVKLVVRK